MSNVIPFAGATHDRAGHRRPDAAWLEAARLDPGSRLVVLTRQGALVHGDVGGLGPDDWYAPTSGRLSVARLTVAGGISEAAVFLGTDDAGDAVFAADTLPDTVDRPDDVQPLDVRAAAALLTADEAGLLAQANTLLHWHRTTRFCAQCGEATTSREGGHLRDCPNGHQHHPRADPVVIMLVVDQERDRVLLGRQSAWPARRYSALAGFVEPGESLEAAVAREVLEEARVEVGAVRYVDSQPWPFPRSLMLGFEADYAAGEAAVGDEELDDVRWCTREEVTLAAQAEVDRSPDAPVLLPPKLAIARHLIDGWLQRSVRGAR